MAHSDGPAERDDVIDPREILLLEVVSARRSLADLIARLRRDRREWDARLEVLQRSSLLTPEQKARLRRP